MEITKSFYQENTVCVYKYILDVYIRREKLLIIIEDNLKMYYYRGLKEWDNEKGYLKDTCLIAQDKYKQYLDYFEIKYGE